jgi:hypothetical protein
MSEVVLAVVVNAGWRSGRGNDGWEVSSQLGWGGDGMAAEQRLATIRDGDMATIAPKLW